MGILFAGLGALGLSACAELSLKNPNYAYSYINSNETYVSNQRFAGELYILKITPDGPRIEAVDNSLSLGASDLNKTAPMTLTSSRISGAEVDVVKFGKTEFSGAAVFEASVTAKNGQVQKVQPSKAASLIEQLYSKQWSEADTVKTLRAEEVLEKDTYYVMVSGVGVAEQLELKHKAPDGTNNGFSLTVGGKQLSGVSIRNSKFYECSQSADVKANCSAVITVYDARLVKNASGGQSLDIYNTTAVKPSVITEAFRHAFAG